jgi:hypothetical protein
VILVARLLLESHSDEGALVSEEMTASVRDLKFGRHPEAVKIADALRTYYENHISSDQQDDVQGVDLPSKDRLYTGSPA